MKTTIIENREGNYSRLNRLLFNRNERITTPAQDEQVSLHLASPNKRANRIAVSSIFFMHGLCFASWASRIPTIQENLNLSPSALGGVLFALPLGFFVSLPFAGWLAGCSKAKC